MFRLCCFTILLALLSVHAVPYTEFTFKEELTYGVTSKITESKKRIVVHKNLIPSVSVSAVESNFNSLIFVGDVLLARNVEFIMRTRGEKYPFVGFDFFDLSSKPAVIGNFEAAIPAEHQPTPIRKIDFSVATWTLPYLREAGFTHLSLANNHSYDFGQKEFRNTRKILQNNFKPLGSPNSVDQTSFSVIELEQIKVGVLALNSLNRLDTQDLVDVMSKVVQETDELIVYVHWGVEYDNYHSDEQKQLAKFLVEGGADLVVGHHPHVVQDVDIIDGTPVFYSLGNYIFDQYFSPSVQEGLVLSLSYNGELGLTLIPVTSRNTLSQPRHMTPKAHKDFLEDLAVRSHPGLHEYISSGYLPLNAELETSEKVAMMHYTNSYVQ